MKTGFEQRPMLYTQKHLFQALTPKSDYNPHRHGFSIEQVKRFPELLASPAVLANSPTREDVLLAILLATDIYDTPLIAGIKPDGTGNYGEREVETNMVLSVYSRQNFIRYFALLRDMDAFVFISGRKIEALEDLSGLPLAGNCSGLDIDRILQRPKCPPIPMEFQTIPSTMSSMMTMTISQPFQSQKPSKPERKETI